MATSNFSSSLTFFLIFFLALTYNSGGGPEMANAQAEQRTWCVARPSTDNRVLQENIDYCCTHVNCNGILEPGYPCYYPNTLINHASVALNLYYQSTQKSPDNCNFKNSGLIVTTDPSYGNCKYL